MTLMYQLFRNNSFALNKMFQQNASRFATFYLRVNYPSRFFCVLLEYFVDRKPVFGMDSDVLLVLHQKKKYGNC